MLENNGAKMVRKKNNTNRKKEESKNKNNIKMNTIVKKNKKNVLKPSKYKIITIILLLAFVFIIGIFLTITVYNQYIVLRYQEIDLFVKVQNSTTGAFNISTDALNFAKTYPGGSSVKRIYMNSLKRAMVHIEADGEIARFISVSDNNFLIAPNEYRQIEVYLSVPPETVEGNYSGKLKIYFYRR